MTKVLIFAHLYWPRVGCYRSLCSSSVCLIIQTKRPHVHSSNSRAVLSLHCCFDKEIIFILLIEGCKLYSLLFPYNIVPTRELYGLNLYTILYSFIIWGRNKVRMPIFLFRFQPKERLALLKWMQLIFTVCNAVSRTCFFPPLRTRELRPKEVINAGHR